VIVKFAGLAAREGLDQRGTFAILKALSEESFQTPETDAELRRQTRHVLGHYSSDNGSGPGRRLLARPASEVEPRPVSWFWSKRIPYGALTMAVGMQGTGKSTLCVLLGAEATTGELDGNSRDEPRTVLFVNLEDDPHSTTVPRLMAAGANLDLVRFVTVERGDQHDILVIPDDVERLTEAVREHNAAALFIDPLNATIGGATDTHNDASVRRVLAPLAQLAESEGIAVVAVSHFTKSGAADALARTSGSLAFTAAARSVLAFGYDPDVEDARRNGARVLAHAKCNVGPQAGSLSYAVASATVPSRDGEAIPTSLLTLLGESETSADALLLPRNEAETTALDEAEEFLIQELAEGERPVKEVRKAASDAGIQARTLKRAKEHLRVESHRVGGSKGAWFWALP
jgi:AAA domain-containing protein